MKKFRLLSSLITPYLYSLINEINISAELLSHRLDMEAQMRVSKILHTYIVRSLEGQVYTYVHTYVQRTRTVTRR